MIREIKNQDKLLAIVIPNNYHHEGLNFLTPDSLSQQLAYMSYPKGKVIQSHIHNKITRTITDTLEVLYLKKGKLLVRFYDDNKKFIKKLTLKSGDLILLISGGHGFEVLEEIEMFEIKQGPYLGELDKVKF